MEKKVIIEYSYGSICVCEATLENAYLIFNNFFENISKEAVNIYNEKNKYLVKEHILEVFNNIITKPIGEKASKTINVTEEAQRELVLYCFNKKIKYSPELGIIDEELFFKDLNFEQFEFLKDNKNYDNNLMIVSDYVDYQTKKLKVIKNNLWKEGLPEHRKINYILNFVNEICHREIRFEIVDVKEKW